MSVKDAVDCANRVNTFPYKGKDIRRNSVLMAMRITQVMLNSGQCN